MHAQVEVLEARVGGFLDAGAVSSRNRMSARLAQREPPAGREIAEEVLDLIAFEESGQSRDALTTPADSALQLPA